MLHLIRDGRDVVCSMREHPDWRWKGDPRANDVTNSTGNSVIVDHKAYQWKHDWEFQMPPELIEGYGYPEVTDEMLVLSAKDDEHLRLLADLSEALAQESCRRALLDAGSASEVLAALEDALG